MAAVDKETLSSVLAAALNKDEKIAFFLDDEDNPANIKEWISTGCDILDIGISNRAHGGMAVGRITELQGLEQSGKTLIAAQILAETQKKGGVAVFIDTENSVSNDFFKALGVDVTKLVYVQAERIEDVFSAIERIIEIVRRKSKKKLVTIVVDSVAAASTEVEMESDYGKDGYATTKAIIISKALRKITNTIGREQITLIFTNQLRVRMGITFGDKYTTSGGKALGFHSSTIIRLKKLGMIKQKVNGVDIVIGVKVSAIMTKNRLGPPQRKVIFDIFFDRGVDNYTSWITVMKEYKILKSSGSSYTYIALDDTEYKFTVKKFVELLESNQELKEEMYQKICDVLIMKYSSEKMIDPANIKYDIDESDD